MPNYVDIIIVVMILIGFILGYKDGVVRKIIGVIGFVLAVYLAFEYSDSLGKFISPFFNDEIYLSGLVAGFLIFSVVILVFAIVKRLLHPFDKVNRFANQFIGGLVGIIQILFFVSAFFMLLNIFDIPDNSTRKDSTLYTPVYGIVPTTIDLIMGDSSQVQNYFEDFIQEKEAN